MWFPDHFLGLFSGVAEYTSLFCYSLSEQKPIFLEARPFAPRF